MDRLASMAVFVRAADLGSFAAAAAALDLSGPMVGKHVRFLEDRLGMRLINRTTRRQSLTEFGRAYYDRCRIVLAEAEAADALAVDQLIEPHGQLRVTMPVLFGRRCVAPVLTELARQHPRLGLELACSDRFSDLAQDGYDLTIRSLPLGSGDIENRSGVMVRRIARQHMVLCASPGYLEQYGRPEQIEDLDGHQAIVYSRAGRIRPWFFARDDQAPLEVTPPSRLRLDDLDAIADAASADMGVAWLPCWLIRQRVSAGALVQLMPDQPGVAYDSYALWWKAPHGSRKVRLAVDALAAALPKFMT